MTTLKHEERIFGMRRFAQQVASAALALATMVAMASCSFTRTSSPAESTTSDSDDVTVVSSLPQWGSLASYIAGDDITVTSIVSSSTTNPHDFEPTTKNVSTIRAADLVIVNGAGYDSWATKSASSSATIVSAAQTVGAMDGDNPHLWFSRDVRKSMAKEIEEALAKAMPSKSSSFAARLATWLDKESSLDKTISKLAKNHDGTRYAATDAIAYYLMSDLGFDDSTPDGYSKATSSESEPSASDIKEFTSLITNSRIDLLVTNADEQSSVAKILSAAAKARSIPIVSVSEKMPDGDDDLLKWISDVVTTISTALGDDASPSSTATTSSSGA
ncbi:zinc ABC transporter substrate-binding protein [uncultured Bifidobacterium sp.]|uniref:metal ABC transporter solute-binding protein, Zn/Mn family n=1 Tax=uncultured Bifidobacterium sp. TaxID=165187 RepID=UPI00262DEB72|nr:zinc ABC transporter substrate-binding protein [uncultured Bifidobacterium sp.]